MFWFVKMLNKKDGNKAIEALHGKTLKNHRLIVKKAKKEESSSEQNIDLKEKNLKKLVTLGKKQG